MNLYFNKINIYIFYIYIYFVLDIVNQKLSFDNSECNLSSLRSKTKRFKFTIVDYIILVDRIGSTIFICLLPQQIKTVLIINHTAVLFVVRCLIYINLTGTDFTIIKTKVPVDITPNTSLVRVFLFRMMFEFDVFNIMFKSLRKMFE